jgi:hypothetical protein
LDDEAIPPNEVAELAIADGHLHGLVFREIKLLELLLLQGAIIVIIFVVEAGAALPVEEVGVA